MTNTSRTPRASHTSRVSRTTRVPGIFGTSPDSRNSSTGTGASLRRHRVVTAAAVTVAALFVSVLPATGAVAGRTE
ncbi:hypothetical protein, partial [Streptomyces lushanensis]|uniref:hypothetical protein n=1 Tax=Streptomyces lushanensis TaxID=1434255 RepID=UPI00114CA225